MCEIRWWRRFVEQIGGHSSTIIGIGLGLLIALARRKVIPPEDVRLVLRGYNKQAVRLLDTQRVLVPVL